MGKGREKKMKEGRKKEEKRFREASAGTRKGRKEGRKKERNCWGRVRGSKKREDRKEFIGKRRKEEETR